MYIISLIYSVRTYAFHSFPNKISLPCTVNFYLTAINLIFYFVFKTLFINSNIAYVFKYVYMLTQIRMYTQCIRKYVYIFPCNSIYSLLYYYFLANYKILLFCINLMRNFFFLPTLNSKNKNVVLL